MNTPNKDSKTVEQQKADNKGATDQDLRAAQGSKTPAASGNEKVIPDTETATKPFTEGSNLGHDSNVLSPVPEKDNDSTHVDPSVSDAEQWVSMPSADTRKI